MGNITAYFKEEEAGATMIEYALLAALISVVAITVITTLGNKVTATMGSIGAAIP